MTQPQLHAYLLDGDGGCSDVSPNQLVEQKAETLRVWVHLDGGVEDARAWLHGHFGPEQTLLVDALLDMETRPRTVDFGDSALIILRGANLNENAHPEDMVSLRLYVDGERVISVQRRNLRAVTDVREALTKGKGPKDTGELVTMLIERLTARMEPALNTLDDATDELEEKVLATGDGQLRQQIIGTRRQTIFFRRYIAPQREAIGKFRQMEADWLTSAAKRRLHEAQDRVTRHMEDLDAIRERAQIVKDELANMMADKLNRNMYVLSVIAAIFLPLGFLTGLFGINIGGMPGVDSHFAFWIFCGSLALVVAVQIWIFRKMKWF